MKKIILFYLIVSALSIADDVNIDLGDSVIRKNYSEREFFVAPREIKNTYVVTQEQIQEKNYKNVEDVLRDSPGVVVNNTAFGPRVDMRGSGENLLVELKF